VNVFPTIADAVAPGGGVPWPARQEAGEVVFRAEYYPSKECIQPQKGVYAMIQTHVYRVTEVVRGQMKLKRFIARSQALNLTPGETYTFRLKRAGAMYDALRKAERGGYTAMSIHGNEIELVIPEKPIGN
jgi:hypothetical protein